MKYLKYLILVSIFFVLDAYEYKYSVKSLDPNTKTIDIIFDLTPDEILYKDSFFVSANNPHIKIGNPSTNSQSININDKQGYKNQVAFSFNISKSQDITEDLSEIIIHNYFKINNNKQTQEKIIPINFNNSETISNTISVSDTTNQTYTPSQKYDTTPQPNLIESYFHKIFNYISTKISKWKQALSSIFTTTGYWPIRLLIALILGILLSLTPCIYPMIPITIGVLQSNKTQSALSSFFIALSYTLGISMTFAVLGLIAAIGGSVFGEIQGSPIFIILIVTILGYLGFAMFGLYEMYIPRFLQPKNTTIKGGSPLSAFVFGAISGTVASPCLSPGLALILNYVSNLGSTGSFSNYFEGFVLLFIFGIGSSLPLLIIGTFSSAVNLLPQAGLWMVEVKKLLGLMLIGMCFYHLSHLEKYLPWFILSWIIAAFILIIGIYYIATIYAYDSKAMKIYKNLMGTIFILISCFLIVQSYKATYDYFYKQEIPSKWLRNYTEALNKAKQENKNLIIDIGASYCSACKALDKAVFQNSLILEDLDKFILVKIESDLDTESYNIVKAKFAKYIKGFPTILVVNSKEEVLKKWENELIQTEIPDIKQELNKLSSQ